MINKEVALILELDQLKTVVRKSYIADASRFENSAEHSWHLAMALMSLKPHLPEALDLNKAIQMALVHDICEIGAGDQCAYENANTHIAVDEKQYLVELKDKYPQFGEEALLLWQEYENQTTLESHWVKVVDKLLPFVLNINTQGKTWKEQNISYDMIVAHHEPLIKKYSPSIYAWMMAQLDDAKKDGFI